MVKIFYLLIFISYFCLIKGNIWDNIFSQMKGPQYSLPEEVELKLTNKATGNLIGKIFVSKSINKIKAILYTINEGEDLFMNFTLNSNDSKIEVFQERACFYYKNDIIKTFPVKFLLNSYDILSYFTQDKENNSYDYYITNPISYNENSTEGILPQDKDMYLKFSVDTSDLVLKGLSAKFNLNKKEYFINAIPEVILRNFTQEEFDYNKVTEGCMPVTPAVKKLIREVVEYIQGVKFDEIQN